jgi:hypothetical protein
MFDWPIRILQAGVRVRAPRGDSAPTPLTPSLPQYLRITHSMTAQTSCPLLVLDGLVVPPHESLFLGPGAPQRQLEASTREKATLYETQLGCIWCV